MLATLTALLLVAAGPVQGARADDATASGWTSPLAGEPVVHRGFQPPDRDWLAGHRGVDLGGAPGATVVTPGSGVVTFAGTVVDRGVVVVLHDDGLRSSLEPVTATLAPGTRVHRGQAVGTVQGDDGTGPSRGAAAPAVAGHCLPASCVHWGVRRGETYLDPLALLGPPEPIVLLPLR